MSSLCGLFSLAPDSDVTVGIRKSTASESELIKSSDSRLYSLSQHITSCCIHIQTDVLASYCYVTFVVYHLI